MAAQNELNELLDNIRKELPERLHDIYEDAVNRATKEGRKQGRHIAKQMVRRNPWLREQRRRQQEEEGALAIFALVIGFIGGLALMYLFDPERGAQRRAMLTQQANRVSDEVSGAVNETSSRVRSEVSHVVDQVGDSLEQASNQAVDSVKDSSQRVQNQATKAANGVENAARQTANEVKSSVTEAKNQVEESASDAALVARVRVELVRNARTPGAIEVAAKNGVVTLTGKVLASEVQPLAEKVRSLTGVRSVENHLEIHDAPESNTSSPNNLNTTPGSTPKQG